MDSENQPNITPDSNESPIKSANDAPQIIEVKVVNTEADTATIPDVEPIEVGEAASAVVETPDFDTKPSTEQLNEPAFDTTQPTATEPQVDLGGAEKSTGMLPGAEAVVPVAIATTTPTGKASKKRFVIILVIAVGVIAAISIVAWLLLAGNKQPVAQDSAQNSVRAPKLGMAVTVVDGTAELQSGDTSWKALTVDSQLGEGDIVRTGADSRIVLTLDDGSAVRLDAGTTLQLTSLVADNVRLTQTGGAVYSRVVASERTYTVNVDDTSYQALGTAFITLAKPGEKGVQVYQSSVKVGDSKTAVKEGEQYYKDTPDTSLKDKITSLNIDALADSEFIKWNLTEDEKDAKFKEKLGVLGEVRQKAEEKAKYAEDQAQKAEEAAKEKVRKDAEAAQVKNKEKEKQDNSDKQKVVRGAMSLTRSGETFSWSYSGKAIHGYKLVYSRDNTVPSFGVDNADYYSDINSTSGKIKDLKKGKTYYIRVCAYTAGSEAEPCIDYSNVVAFTVPE